MVFVVDVLDLIPEALDLGGPSVALSFEVGVASQQLLDQHVGLLQLHPQIVNVPPQFDDGLLVNV